MISRLPTTARLWLAALLCLAPLGFVWSLAITPGTTIYGDGCGYLDDDYVCVPDVYVPGSSSVTLVGGAPVRVFLVLAALGFAGCALARRTLFTRRIARLACASAGVAVALAAGQGVLRVVLCALGALVLCVPLVLGRADVRRFGPQPPAR